MNSRREWKILGAMAAVFGLAYSLALLLAGPALSLPNMLVLIKVMGVKKTVAFSVIIVIAATVTGSIYGRFG